MKGRKRRTTKSPPAGGGVARRAGVVGGKGVGSLYGEKGSGVFTGLVSRDDGGALMGKATVNEDILCPAATELLPEVWPITS
jgi:hypothetical protein